LGLLIGVISFEIAVTAVAAFTSGSEAEAANCCWLS